MTVAAFKKDLLAEFAKGGFFYEARKLNFDRRLHERIVAKLRKLDLSDIDWSGKRDLGKLVWDLPALYIRYERRNVENGVPQSQYENAYLEFKREVDRIVEEIFR